MSDIVWECQVQKALSHLGVRHVRTCWLVTLKRFLSAMSSFQLLNAPARTRFFNLPSAACMLTKDIAWNSSHALYTVVMHSHVKAC
jgi:hypothetical protein